MAQINLNKIKKLDKNRNTIHDKVFSTYSIFEDSGEKYIQIDTYGRTEREMPEKISQSLQFDRDTAKFFVNLLVKEFKLELM
jgi:hypothetical protein